jgi:hypothetical protein
MLKLSGIASKCIHIHFLKLSAILKLQRWRAGEGRDLAPAWQCSSGRHDWVNEEFCSFFLPEVLSCDQMLTSCDYFIMQIGAEVSFGFIRTEPASFEEFDWSTSHSGLSHWFFLL